MVRIDDLDRHREASRRRLHLLIVAFAAIAAVILLRLAYLQVVRADTYRGQFDDWLVLSPDYLPALRGEIVDRNGQVLAQDVPSWQVEAWYGVLDGDAEGSAGNRYTRRLARRLLRDGQYPEDTSLDTIEEAVQQRIARSWQQLSELTDTPTWEIFQAADRIVDRIWRIRRHVANARGFDQPIAEQRDFHPVVTDLTMEQANRLRLELTDYPWLRVHAGTSRHYLDDPAICHVLGRLGAVSAEAMEQDPYKSDELRRLRANDRVGITGAEYLAEGQLRGRYGKVRHNRAGEQIEYVEPASGGQVRLSIDMDLQRRVYERLGQAVRKQPTASGGAAVVLDVRSREPLALVSWPGYTREQFAGNYAEMAADKVRRPLRFRAVSDRYPAGSIVKPVTILTGLMDGLTSPHEQITCTGYFYPGKNYFRCWTTSRGMPGHGPITAVEALMHSCNVYCYTIGRRLGVERLCEGLSRFGLGQPPGTGLLEEATGVLPTLDYLREHHGARLADRRNPDFTQIERDAFAMNFSIGQGEVLLTPIQAANLSATVATGVWKPVSLLAGQSDPRQARALPGRADFWRIARDGMYRVVNDPHGTARRTAHSDHVQIAGKTGTAEASPIAVTYVYELTMRDGSVRTQEFATPRQAREQIEDLGAEVVESRRTGATWWPRAPDPTDRPTHAWFMGFAPAHAPEVAVAVLIEYGGSGGHVAGPVVRDIFEHVYGVESVHEEDTDPSRTD